MQAGTIEFQIAAVQQEALQQQMCLRGASRGACRCTLPNQLAVHVHLWRHMAGDSSRPSGSAGNEPDPAAPGMCME
jgi:hypothetical protein